MSAAEMMRAEAVVGHDDGWRKEWEVDIAAADVWRCPLSEECTAKLLSSSRPRFLEVEVDMLPTLLVS